MKCAAVDETLVPLFPFETAMFQCYWSPRVSPVWKVNGPSLPTVRLSPPLFWSTRPEPVRPVTTPPTV